MAIYAVWFDLEPGPPEKLPAAFGLIEAAEEHGLWSIIRHHGGWRRLPQGVLGGTFPDGQAALEAFDHSLNEASCLLGFSLRARRRLATELAD